MPGHLIREGLHIAQHAVETRQDLRHHDRGVVQVVVQVRIVQQLGQPVHVINGLLPPARGRNILLNLLSWLGFAAIIVGGFWMQIRLDQLTHDAGSLLRGVVKSLVRLPDPTLNVVVDTFCSEYSAELSAGLTLRFESLTHLLFDKRRS